MTDDLLARIRNEISYRHDFDRIERLPSGTLRDDLRAAFWSSLGLFKSGARGAVLGASIGGVYAFIVGGDAHVMYNGAALLGLADSLVYEVRSHSLLSRRAQQRHGTSGPPSAL